MNIKVCFHWLCISQTSILKFSFFCLKVTLSVWMETIKKNLYKNTTNNWLKRRFRNYRHYITMILKYLISRKLCRSETSDRRQLRILWDKMSPYQWGVGWWLRYFSQLPIDSQGRMALSQSAPTTTRAEKMITCYTYNTRACQGLSAQTTTGYKS